MLDARKRTPSPLLSSPLPSALRFPGITTDLRQLWLFSGIESASRIKLWGENLLGSKAQKGGQFLNPGWLWMDLCSNRPPQETDNPFPPPPPPREEERNPP